MKYTIENDMLQIKVNEFGCELSSVLSKTDGYEFLWQGDDNIWSGQSPILFPIVGRLINDSYRLNGKSYFMPKHGFARKNGCWVMTKITDDSITFVLSDNEDTRKIYPYSFELKVLFKLEKNSLSVTHSVLNKSDSVMYFSLGAHPGFNCVIGDKLVFSENETLNSEKIDLEKSLRLPQKYPVLDNSKEITITKTVFNEDALILSGIKSKTVTLYADGEKHKVLFDMGGSPYLGIWAKPGAPYVCIEPWWGVNDSFEQKNDFSEKDGINALAPQEIFNCRWKAYFSN